ncbi:MAG TPA: creatininase family protein [Longimicrobiales bacterium]|nr:creatininase family protein [Longimicrobiales bacterium]
MSWMRVQEYLASDDRVVVPLGSCEQHAYLSLLTDAILSERVAVEAAEPLGVPVYPALPYGVSPYFLGFPGTASLKVSTYLAVVGDILDSLAKHGFRRILMVNGHGGNAPAGTLAVEWMDMHPGVRVKFHSWWNAPETWAKVQETDPVASHGSWMENFPWTRLPDTEVPAEGKEPIDRSRMALMTSDEVRAYLGDGNFAGLYQRPEDEVFAIWARGVEETRRALEGPWV